MSAHQTLFLLRRPIFDRRMEVFAYEVRHRETANQSEGIDAIQAIVKTGFLKSFQGKNFVIQVGPRALSSSFIDVLPPSQAILALRAEEFEDASSMAGISTVIAKGYRLCLDGIDLKKPISTPLKVAKFLRIEVEENLQLCNRDSLFVAKHPGRRAIAVGVHSQEALQKCWSVGFEYFEGQFISDPVIVPGRALPQNRAILFNLLTKLQDPETKIETIELLISSDVVLSYRLIRLVNSACLNSGQRVDSIRQALVVLGFNRVASMVSMLAMSGIKDKPMELTLTGMIRGKLCESMARKEKLPDPDRFFMLGLLSVLPAMFDMPMPEILDQLPLSTDMVEALIDPNGIGFMAKILQTVLAYEEGMWDSISVKFLGENGISESYVSSVNWAFAALESSAA